MSGAELALLDRALELLGDGELDGAVNVLFELRDGPEALPPPCAVCGARAWPGDLARHVYSAHAAVAA